MEKIWDELYVAAKQVLRPRRISDRMEAGGVAAAVEAGSGRVYVGVCVDAACSLGVCAERNAIFNMITCGESVLRRVVAVDWDGRALPPLRGLQGAHGRADAGDLQVRRDNARLRGRAGRYARRSHSGVVVLSAIRAIRILVYVIVFVYG